MRKIVLLTENRTGSSPKTAINLIRYTPEEVVAVFDRLTDATTSRELLGIGSVPVIRTLDEAPGADTLVIGIAPSGGKLPEPMRDVILEAAGKGWTVISGLHTFLADDPELAAVAQGSGAKLVDVRKNNERDVTQRTHVLDDCLRVHTVGADCNVGKMVVSLELARALKAAGRDAKFVATGQTGIMIEGDGCPIDAVVADFINGAAERLVLKNQAPGRILSIEGQGSIIHPRYSSVTLGLLHGSIPQGLILCYESGRTAVSGMPHIPLPSLESFIHLYETMANAAAPSKVIAIGMNSRTLSAEAAQAEKQSLQEELDLPVVDVIREGACELVEAVLKLEQSEW